MPAATVSPQAIDWPNGYVIAPDAFYHRALVHYDRAERRVDVYNKQGGKQATYNLAEGHSFSDHTNELRGTLIAGPADTGDILVRPDTGCGCLGYKKTAR